jgi:hypothetical protein
MLPLPAMVIASCPPVPAALAAIVPAAGGSFIGNPLPGNPLPANPLPLAAADAIGDGLLSVGPWLTGWFEAQPSEAQSSHRAYPKRIKPFAITRPS